MNLNKQDLYHFNIYKPLRQDITITLFWYPAHQLSRAKHDNQESSDLKQTPALFVVYLSVCVRIIYRKTSILEDISWDWNQDEAIINSQATLFVLGSCRTFNYLPVFVHVLTHNGRQFADDTYRCIFLNENVSISIEISLKFVPQGPINITSIGSDNGLAPTRRQVIIWTNDG